MPAAQDKTASSTDVATVSEYAALATADGLSVDVLRENIGTGGMRVFDLDRVKVPAGGGRAWEIPELDGSVNAANSIEGVIVAWRDPRAYWRLSLDESGGGAPPDCSSDDGVLGRGEFGVGSDAHPSGECATCPMSQWGSKPDGGNAQACKQMRLLFILQPDNLLPLALFAPPTSIGPIKRYFMRLSTRGIRYYEVVTALSLTHAESNGGITYSQVEPRLVGRLSADDAARVKAYSDSIQDALATVQVRQEDVQGT